VSSRCRCRVVAKPVCLSGRQGVCAVESRSLSESISFDEGNRRLDEILSNYRLRNVSQAVVVSCIGVVVSVAVAYCCVTCLVLRCCFANFCCSLLLALLL
jgi:hypothetical protein